ncbi:MAG: MBOAT family protein [Oscillospiraceae bacterium]
MVFSSLIFLFVFLPAVLLIYYICPAKYRNLFLFIASLIFYAWGEPIYITIMLFSTVFDFANGLLIEKFKQNEQNKKAKIVLINALVVNLAILCFFKYTDFFLANINTLFSSDVSLLKIALPIGISFYTFQTMSYTIDVYRGEVKAQKNIIAFGTFVSLFPQLVAGPIVRYKTIADQLEQRKVTSKIFAQGVGRFVFGLAKKVLLANNIGVLWNQISTSPIESLPVATAWLGAVAFSFQIYFDFSGYSDMAIGLGKMFGFEFLENFNYPYISKSITEFWRRWHISLSTWFREYVYIPLGGNRGGKAKQIRNIIIVWALTGFWHGANWNFIVWGLYFAVWLIIEKLFLLKYLEKLPAAFSHIYTLSLVLFSWVIFAFDDFSKVILYFKAMFGMTGSGFADQNTIYLLYTNIILLVVLTIASTRIAKTLSEKVFAKYSADNTLLVVIKNIIYAVLFIVSVSFLVGDSYNPFLYFRF